MAQDGFDAEFCAAFAVLNGIALDANGEEVSAVQLEPDLQSGAKQMARYLEKQDTNASPLEMYIATEAILNSGSNPCDRKFNVSEDDDAEMMAGAFILGAAAFRLGINPSTSLLDASREYSKLCEMADHPEFESVVAVAMFIAGEVWLTMNQPCHAKQCLWHSANRGFLPAIERLTFVDALHSCTDCYC